MIWAPTRAFKIIETGLFHKTAVHLFFSFVTGCNKTRTDKPFRMCRIAIVICYSLLHELSDCELKTRAF